MCGILACFRNRNVISLRDELKEFDETKLAQGNIRSCNENELLHELIPYITRRGPDYASLRSLHSVNATFFSSVLSLRSPFTKQSVLIEDRYVLQYNGELYNKTTVENSEVCDTEYIVSGLQKNDVLKVIRSCYGEFAYAITDLLDKKVYFGRDSIGKRSLSYRLDEEELYITSTSGKCSGFLNCLAGVIYIFDLETRTLTDSTTINDAYSLQVSPISDKDKLNLNVHEMQLYEVLSESVYQRITTIHPIHPSNRNICVLFSGGLDCSVLVALLCEQLMKTGKNDSVRIELLNVGFENPRTGKSPHDTPDRILAQKSSELLQHLYPQVVMKLVEVDVTYEEYLEKKQTVIELISPKNTEMDLSIAIALYFASRGHGYVVDDGVRIPYERSGIVLFSGLGADELYGGYHKLSNMTTEKLVEELQRQIENIHDRNLNRDDKVISDNGVEVRYPFLDECVVSFSVNLPINYKTNKLILRSMAKNILNLGFISDEPKRAIQFGARSAKMTKSSGKKGTDILK